MKRWGIWAIALSLVLSLLLGGCGSANLADGDTAVSNDSGGAGAADKASIAAETTEAEAPAANGGGTPSEQAAAGGDSGSAAAGFQGSNTALGLNKKLIYRANVTMEVKDYGKAQSEIRNLITLTGGYIVEFSETKSEYELGGNFILKVPADGFSPFLDRLAQLQPESLQQSIEGQDVSEEYVDLESRLKVKQAMEARYLKFVGEATKTADLVEFANELERIQTEIEQIKGRMRYIDNNVSFSTIEIRVFQPVENSLIKQEEKQDPLWKRAQNALTGSIDVISMLLQWLVIVISALLPLIVIAAVILAIIWPLRRRKQKQRIGVKPEWPAGQVPSLPQKEEVSFEQSDTPSKADQEDEDLK
ncbi:DUF4349 domain-containing protein [Paenibacillus sp. M1]|uniref:DUF4349 domain-containing protein n=1 Tax=Paenibacillus haidiansis TaxID=1574488 RepID=A0ABU7VQX5_9BACL